MKMLEEEEKTHFSALLKILKLKVLQAWLSWGTAIGVWTTMVGMKSMMNQLLRMLAAWTIALVGGAPIFVILQTKS